MYLLAFKYSSVIQFNLDFILIGTEYYIYFFFYLKNNKFTLKVKGYVKLFKKKYGFSEYI